MTIIALPLVGVLMTSKDWQEVSNKQKGSKDSIFSASKNKIESFFSPYDDDDFPKHIYKKCFFLK